MGSGTGFAGSTLKVFNAATGAAEVTLGTLPSGGNMMFFGCFGNTNNVLCQAMYEVTTLITPAPLFPSFQTDVFFINTITAGSLTRVTNTADKSESPLH